MISLHSHLTVECHILLLVVDFVGVRVQINFWRTIVCEVIMFSYAFMTLILVLEGQGH